LVAAAGLLAVVVARCMTHPAPLVEPAIARTRAVALANLGALVFFGGFGAMLLGSVLFQTSVWHDSVLRAGLQLAPGPAMAALFAFPSGILGQRVGQRFVGAAGGLLFAAGTLWFRTHMAAAPDYAGALLPSQLLAGTGVGLVLPSVSAAATGPLPPTRFATGTAVLGMSRQVGTALGVAVLVAVIGHPNPADAVDAFRDGWTFIIASGLSAGAVLLSVGPVRIGGAEEPVEDLAPPGVQPQSAVA
jgi:MFS family permease